MYLKNLTLKGFKSFADRSVLSLEPGVTAIVGPNGSGKSNISDAVLWVLGERNAKNLRGQVMEDVIFAGSSARKSVGVAEVELVLDNSDGALPVDYEEVSIGRRMYRNGESEYLINGSTARRMDVLDILHDSGLGTGTYSIISQGNLDAILQSKPEDRRSLIEEAAGTLKHKQRKAKSERRLEMMEQHVSRVKDVVAEIERQLGPLERKAKKALQYNTLSEQLQDLSLQLAVDDVRILKQRYEELTAKEEAAVSATEQCKQHIQVCEEQSNACQELMRSGSEAVAELARKHASVTSYADKFDSQVLLFQEKLRNAKLRSAELQTTLSEGLQRRAGIDEELAELKKQLDELSVQVNAAQANLKAIEQNHAQAVKTLSELERDVFDRQRKRRDADSQEQRIRVSYTKAQEQLSLAQGRAEMWQERMSTAQARLEQTEAAFTAAQESLNALQEEKSKCEQEAEAAKAAYEQCKLERKAAEQLLRETEDNYRAINGRIAALEELERVSLSAQSPAAAWVREQDEFNLVPLLQQLKVDEEYAPLVEMLLGEDLSALVVQDLSSVERIREAAQNAHQQGVVSFVLPGRQHECSASALNVTEMSLQDSQKQQASDLQNEKNLQEFHPYGEYLLNHIHYPKQLHSFMYELLGKMLVCQDFETALKAYSEDTQGLHFVTPDAELLLANGKICVGQTDNSEHAGVFARAAELEKLAHDRRDVALALDNARADYELLQNKVSQAQERELEATRNAAHVKGNFAAAEKECQQAEKRLESAKHEHEDTVRRNEELLRSIEKSKPELEELKTQLDQAVELVKQEKAALVEAQKAVSPARDTESSLARKLADEKLSYAMLAERETYLRRVIQAREEELASVQTTQTNAQAALQIQRVVEKRAVPFSQALELLSQAARKQARAIEDETHMAESSSSDVHEQARLAYEMLRQAREKLDESNAALTNLRVEKGRLEVQVEAAVSVIARDFNMPVEKALELPELADRALVENDAFAIKRKITNMGTINPDAAEEYEQLKVRYDYLAGQLNDLSSARSSLKKIDALIDKRMRESFKTTFEQANENFKEIFSVLFPGGSGELVLDNPDDLETSGIEVIAQPRGKKITKMTLMSGGEKSLVALALLFAVYRIRTTPFYILDEVEAALDDTNLRRLIAYLNDLRDTTQLLMITHQRRTMEMADVLFGVSMQADGVTKVLSQRLEHALNYAE